LARSRASLLLALLCARVAREEPFVLEPLPQFEVVLDERAGDPEPYGSRLPGHTAAGNGCQDVKLIGGFRQNQRLANLGSQSLGWKERFEGSAVDADRAAAGPKKHAGGGRLASPGSIVLDCCHVYATSSLDGFCAACG